LSGTIEFFNKLNKFLQGENTMRNNFKNAISERPDSITIKGERYSTALTELDLSYKELNDDDIKPLKYMSNLTVLNLDVNDIGDLTPLAELKNLTTLIVGKDQEERLADNYKNYIHDLTPLSELTSLTKLDLFCNNIVDITPLACLVNLTELNLADNCIRDISPLAGLVNLNYANLMWNDITDLSPLAGLVSLNNVNLYCNDITDWSPVDHVGTVRKRVLKKNG